MITKLIKDKKKFLRFQMTAVVATCVDFLVTIFLKEVFQVHYAFAVAIGAGSGAITAFSINRYWVFKSIQTHPVEQGIRYVLVAAGSVALNTAGTYLLTETFFLSYIVSKTIVAIVIGFTYSYYLSRRFVFYA